MTHPHVAVLGPTCSWKSATALRIAERLGGEIVNCDSMQVYRGLDIGTAKPSPCEQRRARHHLLDCLDPHEPCDAADYVVMAETCLANLEGRGGRAVLAGGTGLYARSLIYGLRMLPADAALAAALQERLKQPGGLERLRQEFVSRLGPSRAEATPPHVLQNPRRLMRALEVLTLTGEAPWDLHRQQGRAPRFHFDQYVILPDMAVLRPRIAARTTAMLQAGWIDEARGLIADGLLATPTARQAMGYAEIADFLAGKIPGLAQLEEAIVRRTVAYARRQRTWFRHQHPGAVTLCVRRAVSAEELAEVILQDRENRARAAAGFPVPLDLVIA